MSAAVQGHPQVKDGWSHDQPCSCPKCRMEVEGEDQVVSATRRRPHSPSKTNTVAEFPRPESMFGEFHIERGDPEKSVWLFVGGAWITAMMGMMSGDDAEELWNSLPKDGRFSRRENDDGVRRDYPYFKLMDGSLFFIQGGQPSAVKPNTSRCMKFTFIVDPSGTQERKCEGQSYSCEGGKRLRLWGPYPSN